MNCPHENCGWPISKQDVRKGICPKCKRILLELDDKPKLTLPGYGKLITEFAQELAGILSETNDLFFRIDSKDIVEIGTVKANDKEEEKYTGFLVVKPNRFITLIEKHITPGRFIVKNKGKVNEETTFKELSITSELSNTLIASEIIQKAIPQITRIFTTPIPIIYEGKITFPQKGYDKRFSSWLPHDAPELTKPEMTLEEAKEELKKIFKGFCFETTQDYHNAIAALLTPYLRGLYPRFNVRTPVWFYVANRERAGKDYLAGITGLVHDGNNIEEPPICNGEKNGGTSEELRKKILAALLSGRKRMHFSNNKGYIDNAVFESVTTAERYTDRILGRSENADFANELEFSLSGNVGITFTPDFANRCRFIRLFLEIENANERTFDIPDLHGYVLENRGMILSALYALVRNWVEKESPAGAKPFASYYNWANVCGGIMEAAGYLNPCEIDREVKTVAGDFETQEMKLLFELCHTQFGSSPIRKESMISLIHSEDLFDWLDLETNKAHQMEFSLLLKKFIGRVLSGIKLVVVNPSARPGRWEFKFTKELEVKSLVEF